MKQIIWLFIGVILMTAHSKFDGLTLIGLWLSGYAIYKILITNYEKR